MKYQIEIVEGHDPSSYFWIRPVTISDSNDRYWWDRVSELEEEISIEEGYISDFLFYFLTKYFDKELSYNKMRVDEFEERIVGFEWYLTHNFYTYECMDRMLKEIDDVALLLQTDYHNPKLVELKKGYSTFSMCSIDDPDYGSNSDAAIERHIPVVIDFYGRFTSRMRKMMENNRNTSIISFMGP